MGVSGSRQSDLVQKKLLLSLVNNHADIMALTSLRSERELGIVADDVIPRLSYLAFDKGSVGTIDQRLMLILGMAYTVRMHLTGSEDLREHRDGLLMRARRDLNDGDELGAGLCDYTSAVVGYMDLASSVLRGNAALDSRDLLDQFYAADGIGDSRYDDLLGLNLGRALHLHGRVAAAEIILETVVESSPAISSQARYLLGEVRRQEGVIGDSPGYKKILDEFIQAL